LERERKKEERAPRKSRWNLEARAIVSFGRAVSPCWSG